MKDREDKWTKLEQLAKRNLGYHCNGDNSLSNSSACSPSGNDADVEDFDIYERIEMGAKHVSTNDRRCLAEYVKFIEREKNIVFFLGRRSEKI